MRTLLRLLFLHSLLLLLTLPITEATATTPLEWPDRFTVFWNVPTEDCFLKYGVEMPLAEYGIVHNTNQTINGDMVATLYEYQHGKYPYFYHHHLNDSHNGGIPQNVDLDLHLKEVEKYLNDEKFDVNFNGPLYIDVEEWRPNYNLNWGKKEVYKSESQRSVRERHPDWPKADVEKQAEKEFNEGSKNLLTKTLALVRRLLPKAVLSMYGFPYCNWPGDKRYTEEKKQMDCEEKFKQQNNDIKWLTDQFDALAPSIYVSDSSDTTGKSNYRFMHAYMLEAQRIAKTSPRRAVIAPYTKFEYNPYQDDIDKQFFYSKRDLCTSLKMTADFGGAGALLWSASATMSRERCFRIRANIVHSLGPIVQLVRDRANRCARERCSDRGRCVRKIAYTADEECNFRMPIADYECACDEGYQGDKCEPTSG